VVQKLRSTGFDYHFESLAKA